MRVAKKSYSNKCMIFPYFQHLTCLDKGLSDYNNKNNNVCVCVTVTLFQADKIYITSLMLAKSWVNFIYLFGLPMQSHPFS